MRQKEEQGNHDRRSPSGGIEPTAKGGGGGDGEGQCGKEEHEHQPDTGTTECGPSASSPTPPHYADSLNIATAEGQG